MTVGGDSLTLELDREGTVSLPLTSIDKFEVRRERSSRAGLGAVCGLLGGAAVGAIVGYAADDDEATWSFLTPDAAAVGGILGGIGGLLVGTVVGACVGLDYWERVEPSAMSLDLRLVTDPAGGLALVIGRSF